MVRVRELAKRLIEIPGVVAVTLGGSRGLIRPDSEWGFGVYYRDAIRAEDVRALGFEGTVVEPGDWGRLANGGDRDIKMKTPCMQKARSAHGRN